MLKDRPVRVLHRSTRVIVRLTVAAVSLMTAAAAPAQSSLIVVSEGIDPQAIVWFDDGSFAPREAALLNRPIATRPLYTNDWLITRNSPTVGQGRVWQSDAIIGGTAPLPVRERADRQPSYFGAPTTDESTVWAVDGGLVLPVSPFIREDRPNRERARQFWLRERGLVGGVRTFRNPLVDRGIANGAPEQQGAPEPAGWFRRPLDLPRTRSEMRVRVSLPPGLDPRAAHRLAEQPGVEVITSPRRTAGR